MRFFFNDTATTEIYTLSLHDALPILLLQEGEEGGEVGPGERRVHRSQRDADQVLVGERELLAGLRVGDRGRLPADRKSTRLNSSHANISYAVFCLKKKKSLVSLLVLF